MSAAIAVTVMAGSDSPSAVSSDVVDAIQELVVRRLDDGTSTFQIVLDATPATQSSSDFPIISEATFSPGNRIKIGLRIGSNSSPLIDGVVTYQELTYDRDERRFVYSIIGEDLSVYMRLEDKAVEWPERSAAQIVREILATYASKTIEASIITPEQNTAPTKNQWIWQQNSNDFDYIRELAQPFGYVFRMQPGSTLSAQSTAYWGPPSRDGSPLAALSVEMGAYSNVIAIDFGYDATAASTVSGQSRKDDDTGQTLALASADFSLKRLSGSAGWESAIARKGRIIDASLAGDLATAAATARAQDSSRCATVAHATIDGTRYEAIVAPGAIVPVRGVGQTHNGLYYVEEVEHRIKRGSYSQKLTLTREGYGSTISSVSA